MDGYDNNIQRVKCQILLMLFTCPSIIVHEQPNKQMDKFPTFWAFAAILLLYGTTVLCEDNDACYYRQNGEQHPQCWMAGGRELMRSIDCADNNTYQICCYKPVPETIEKSRQKLLSTIVSIGDKLSRSCTKRILCEQSCFNDDGLKNNTRLAGYPLILLQDSIENEYKQEYEYLRAYYHQDSLVCANLAQTNFYSDTQPKLTNTKKSKIFSHEECQSECTKKYSDCQDEMDTNFAVQCYYESARLFHKLGLWFFSAFHLTFDTFRDGGKNHESANKTIESAFTDLYHRMVNLENAYVDWSTQRVYYPIKSESEMWKLFFTFYRTDPVLVEHFNGSLDHKQFVDLIAVINQTLLNTNFEPNNTCVIDPSVQIFTSPHFIVIVIVIVFVVCLIIILSLIFAPTNTKKSSYTLTSMDLWNHESYKFQS